MGKNHLKRIAMPKTWHLPRKETIFLARPNPGSAILAFSMPLSLVMKELIKCVKTTKEVKSILKTKGVFVDERRRWDDKYNVGLMDTIALPTSNEYYRLLLNTNGKLDIAPISKDEASMKLVKIVGKTILNKDHVQINLSSGRNLIVKIGEKGAGAYNVHDTLMLSLPGQQIKQHLKFEAGCLVYLTGGKHTGKVGKLVGVNNDKTISLETPQGIYKTEKYYAFVIGKEKSVITLPQ
ncbi:TPA: 30S ribosomal protein S4e [Candidatus Woesearchaeota archaeon]|nr:MAG: small subunit ribosomal protein S4e [archaeon GW2011_AR16]HIG96370.1 30S ribosomal protein S4e [Candidatus Woesearchaeota archaeon]HIH46805.1 30S ribosomal protein S4e [Candidatus Woesearchaeota archaeon]HII89286.1 30S ribosomal protein S4e [Candidatus Woesearchaeota archaeon]